MPILLSQGPGGPDSHVFKSFTAQLATLSKWFFRLRGDFTCCTHVIKVVLTRSRQIPASGQCQPLVRKKRKFMEEEKEKRVELLEQVQVDQVDPVRQAEEVVDLLWAGQMCDLIHAVIQERSSVEVRARGATHVVRTSRGCACRRYGPKRVWQC